MTDLDTGPSSIRDDSICESSLNSNKSSGDIGELKACPFCGKPPVHAHSSGIFCVTEGCVIDGVHCMDPAEWNNRAGAGGEGDLALALKPFADAANGPSSTGKSDDFLIWQDITIGDLRRAEQAWNTRTPDPESAAEIERLRREVEQWAAQSLKEDDCRKYWQSRALTAESAVSAAYENAAKIAETFPSEVMSMWGRPNGPPGNGMRPSNNADIASALRAAVSKKTGEV